MDDIQSFHYLFTWGVQSSRVIVSTYWTDSGPVLGHKQVGLKGANQSLG